VSWPERRDLCWLPAPFTLEVWFAKCYTLSMRLPRIVLLLWIVLLLIVPLSAVAAQDQESEGKEKIEETIKRIEEEEEEAAKAKKKSGSKRTEDEEDSYTLFDFLLDLFGEIFWEYCKSVRFYDYPYAEPYGHHFSTMSYMDFSNRKFVSFQASADLANHLDGTWGNINRLTLQLAAVHFNVFNQTIFSGSTSLSLASFNGGLSLLLGNFTLSGFCGGYIVTTTDTATFCVGLSSRIFLPAKLYADIYILAAALSEAAQFRHLTATLNLALWRFSVGVGYDRSRIVDSVFAGPCFKVSFWL
jgi:hypothetical protein